MSAILRIYVYAQRNCRRVVLRKQPLCLPGGGCEILGWLDFWVAAMLRCPNRGRIDTWPPRRSDRSMSSRALLIVTLGSDKANQASIASRYH
eukprot:6203748-Pleurochrysis_carterae.AAC.5